MEMTSTVRTVNKKGSCAIRKRDDSSALQSSIIILPANSNSSANYGKGEFNPYI